MIENEWENLSSNLRRNLEITTEMQMDLVQLNARHVEIRDRRKRGQVLGEIMDAGYSAVEVVTALGVMQLADDLGLLEDLPDGDDD